MARHLRWMVKMPHFLPLISVTPYSFRQARPVFPQENPVPWNQIQRMSLILPPLRKDRFQKLNSCLSERAPPNPTNLNPRGYPSFPSPHLFGSSPSPASFIHRCPSWVRNTFRSLTYRHQNWICHCACFFSSVVIYPDIAGANPVWSVALQRYGD